MSERIVVAVDLDGSTQPAGSLHVDARRTLTSTYTYRPEYLQAPHSYALDPRLLLQEGPSHTAGLPGALSDTAPDRWGRNLIRKRLMREGALGGRTITELDYLLGVSDVTRQGALRVARQESGPYLAEHGQVPPLIALPRLLRAADKVAREDDGLAEVKALLDAGSGSLGGARPKASVADGGHLAIAKFPHPGDDWDVMAWEAVALELAETSGIDVPARRVLHVDGQAVLLVRRFDRIGTQRVGYLSAMSLIGAQDGEHRDYVEVAEALAEVGAAPAADLEQLWRRVAFSIAINNTDDHLRNLGFLHEPAGWRLSPAFDLNPNPYRTPRVTGILGAVDRHESGAALLEAAPAFGLDPASVRAVLADVQRAVAGWVDVARAHGVRDVEVELMADAFAPS